MTQTDYRPCRQYGCRYDKYGVHACGTPGDERRLWTHRWQDMPVATATEVAEVTMEAHTHCYLVVEVRVEAGTLTPYLVRCRREDYYDARLTLDRVAAQRERHWHHVNRCATLPCCGSQEAAAGARMDKPTRIPVLTGVEQGKCCVINVLRELCCAGAGSCHIVRPGVGQTPHNAAHCCD